MTPFFLNLETIFFFAFEQGRQIIELSVVTLTFDMTFFDHILQVIFGCSIYILARTDVVVRVFSSYRKSLDNSNMMLILTI